MTEKIRCLYQKAGKEMVLQFISAVSFVYFHGISVALTGFFFEKSISDNQLSRGYNYEYFSDIEL